MRHEQGPERQIRVSGFDYAGSGSGDTGLLTAEYSGASVSSCSTAGWQDSARASAKLIVKYQYDSAGNRIITSRKYFDAIDSFRIRAEMTEYDAQKRYPVKSKVLDGEVPAIPGTSNPNWRTIEHVLERDRFGNVLHKKDELGNDFHAYYDEAGILRAEWGPFGDFVARSTVQFHPACPTTPSTRYAEVTAALSGAYSVVCKDLLGREIRSATRAYSDHEEGQGPSAYSGPLIYTDTFYDYQSRPVAVSEPYFDVGRPENNAQCAGSSDGFADVTCLAQPLLTRTIYDAIGRVVRIYLPRFVNGVRVADLQRRITYAGLEQKQFDEMGYETSTEHDLLGRKVRTVAEDGTSTRFTYDPLGQLIEVNGPDSVAQIQISYDSLGNKTSLDDSDKGFWTYQYNALGELVCQIDAEGNRVRLHYDALGRTIARQETKSTSGCSDPEAADVSTTWTYAPAGQTSGSAKSGQLEQVTTTYHVAYPSQFGDGPNPLAGFSSQTTFQYDGLGRLQLTSRQIGGITYEESVFYDQHGRVKARRDATGDGRGERYLFSSSGHVRQVYEARTPIGPEGLLQHVHRMNARGDAIDLTTGNGTVQQRIHDPATGATLFAIDRLSDGRYATFYEYLWDEIGNLVRRTNLADGVGIEEEHFFYDQSTGRRLSAAWRSNGSGSAAPHPLDGGEGWSLSDSLSYDRSGNIVCKRDGTSTHCGNGGGQTHRYEQTGGAGPHAVTQATLDGSAPVSFAYDANGNMVSRSGSGPDHSFHYSASSQLEAVCGAGVGCTLIAYGPDRQRLAKWEYDNSPSPQLQTLTHYVNGLEFDYDEAQPGSPSQAHTIRRPVAGGGLEQIERFGTALLARMLYLHTDHLGSVVAVSDANGQIEARMAFDAWGQRRDPWSDAAWVQWSDLRPVWAEAMLAITPRGFTGHEHLDRHGLIHMNGRIYDPRLGRFLQADPFIEDTGTLNRYTYVLNNPLSYSDPSGHFSFKEFFRLAVTVAISFYTQTWITHLLDVANYGGAVAVAAGGGGLSGAVSTGTWDGALSGAFTSVASLGIGKGLSAAQFKGNFLNTGLNAKGFALKIAAHGAVGGVSAELQGGKFGHGFLSSGVTAAVSPRIYNPDGNKFAQIALAAVVGGTVSELTGGKFANGAMTAAMQFALNQGLTNVKATQAQRDAVTNLDADEVYGADRTRETKFYMNDEGEILGTSQKGCFGGDRCGISKSELPDGTSLIGHTHAPADLPRSQRLTGRRARIADMTRDVPGPGDANPLKLGNGYASAIITPRGYRYLIEGSPQSPRLQYLGGGDPNFGRYIESNWHPGISRSQTQELVRKWMNQ